MQQAGIAKLEQEKMSRKLKEEVEKRKWKLMAKKNQEMSSNSLLGADDAGSGKRAAKIGQAVS